MSGVLIWSTIGVLLLAVMWAYGSSRDPLHPLMYLGPLMFYVYGWVPVTLYHRGLLEDHYPDPDQLLFVLGVNLVAITLFCGGCLLFRLPGRVWAGLSQPLSLTPQVRNRLRWLSILLGGIGLLAYAYVIVRKGGLMAAYGTYKGGGSSSSGYISEAPLLTLPAILIYLLARRGQPFRPGSVFMVLALAAPHLLQGLLGARRGPTFLAFATLGFGYYLARRRRPSLRAVVAGVGAVGLLMLFLVSQRREIYIGSSFEFDADRFTEAIAPTLINSSHTTLVSWDAMLTAQHQDRAFWGRRYAVQLLVRPIPKQLWPDKYESTGMQWMVTDPGSAGYTPFEWRAAVNRFPERGAAIGIVGDTFLEFGWAGTVLCMLVGMWYGFLWRKSVTHRGFWSVLYLEAAVVSVYIPTQGLVSAWLYRFLFLAIPSWLLWKGMMIPSQARKWRIVARPA